MASQHPARKSIVLAVLAAGLLAGAMAPKWRLADASSYAMMADSLWHDCDVRFTPQDLRRAREMGFADLPAGLFLNRNGGQYYYSKALLYPLVAVPFYALLGVRGFLVLNGLLLALLVLLGADILASRIGWKAGLAFSAVLLLFSATPVYLVWIDPFLLLSVLIAGALAAYRRKRAALSAVLLAMAASCRAPYALLLVAPAATYLLGDRYRELLKFAAAAAIAFLLFGLAAEAASGQWSPYLGTRFYYLNEFPFENPARGEVGFPASKDYALDLLGWPGFGAVLRSNEYFFFGRFAGVLLYYPTLLVCLFWVKRWDREKTAWLLGLLAVCVAIQIVLPHNFVGGAHAVGNRLFTMLPVGLLMVDRRRLTAPRLIGSGLLAALALPLVSSPLALSITPGSRMAQLPYRLFPLEWTQATAMYFPFAFPGIYALTYNQSGWEPPGGVWTIPGREAVFVLIIPKSGQAVVELTSTLPAACVSDGTFRRSVRFRDNSPVRIVLAHPMAEYYDESQRLAEVSVYRLAIDTRKRCSLETVPAAGRIQPSGVFVRPIS